MSEKRNVSVCRGHELANALYNGQWDVSLYPIKQAAISTEVYKKPRETQVHKQGRCVLLRLLNQPFRKIFKEIDKRFYNCINKCKK